jgi:hypothetical protein
MPVDTVNMVTLPPLPKGGLTAVRHDCGTVSPRLLAGNAGRLYCAACTADRFVPSIRQEPDP